MDPARVSHSNNVIVEAENHQSLQQLPLGSNLKALVNVTKGSEFQTDSQGVQVVATGYSDEVPPDTTVLIYTDRAGSAEGMSMEEVTDEYVVQEVTSDTSMIIDNEVRYVNALPQSDQSNQLLSEIGHSSELISHKTVVSMANVSSDTLSSDSKQKIQILDQEKNLSRSSSTTSSPRMYTSVSSPAGGISRILIPSKKAQPASPWSVNDEEDAANALSEISGMFSGSSKVSSFGDNDKQDKSSSIFKTPQVELIRPSDESNTKPNVEGKEGGDGLNSMGKYFCEVLQSTDAVSGGLDSIQVAEFAERLENPLSEVPQSTVTESNKQ